MKQSEIAQMIPGIFQRTLREDNPLSSLLGVMETLHEPSERILESLGAKFNPYLTTEGFVIFLAGWVDLQWLLHREVNSAGAEPPISTGLGRLRELVARAAELSRWRGTARGLILFLETATGRSGFEIDEAVSDEQGRNKPFHIRVRGPQEAAPHRELVRKIVEMEKPAYVTFELAFG